MELPTTVAALLIAAFAVLPGVPGEKIYTLLVGWDWREDKWLRTLRILSFSLVGLAVYAIVAPMIGAPPPAYISPKSIEQMTAAQIAVFAAAFLGHVAGASMCGALAGLAIRIAARLTARSAYSSSWDHFMKACVRGRWVTVRLTTGETYAGFIDTADVSVAANERDVILREPAMYDEQRRTYRSLQYQTMFLLGSTLAAVTDLSIDKRITRVGEELFQEDSHGSQ
jgi:hypothetical protein